MGKEKKDLHPADKERKKLKQRDLKRNAGLRKTHRESILGAKSPDEILSEIHKINRLVLQGLADDKAEVRKKQLIDAHKSAIKKLNETKQVKSKEGEEPQVIIKGMNKIFRTKGPEKKDEDQLTIENKMEDGGIEEEAKEELREEAKEVHREEKSAFTERRDRAHSRFTEDDLSAMTFDDTMVIPVEDEEALLLEAPPGILRPPGIRGRRQRNRPQAPISIPQGPLHLVNPGPAVGPPRPIERVRPERERRVHIDPLDLESGFKEKEVAAVVAAAQQNGMEGEEEVSQEVMEEDVEGENNSADHAIPSVSATKSAIISAAPQKPALPSITPASIAFIPTALLVKNRHVDPVVRRPPPSAIAAKKLEKTAKAQANTKRSKPAAVISNSAYDEFMKEMEGLDDI